MQKPINGIWREGSTNKYVITSSFLSNSYRSSLQRGRIAGSLQICLWVLLGVLCSAPAPGQHTQNQVPQTSTGADASLPRSPESLDPVTQARTLSQSGKLEEAERVLCNYLQDHGTSADAHYLLGYVYFQQIHEQAQVDSSIPDSKGRSPDPDFREAKAKQSLSELREGAKYRDPGAFELKLAALDYILLKDYPDADKWLARSLQLNGNDADGWYYLGRTKYKENRFSEAVEAFEKYLKLVPGSVKGEDNLGLSYQGLNRNEDAIGAYKTAIRWQRGSLIQDSGPFLDLGSLLIDQNQPQQALGYLQQAVAISPGDARGHEQLGKAYDKLGDFEKAQAEVEKAVGLSPQNPRLHYVLGRVYQKEGLPDKAKREFDQSEALRKNSRSEDDD